MNRREPAQVLAVVVAADHHDDRPAARCTVRGLRDALAVQQQLLLAAEELGGVVGEALQLGGQPAAGVLHQRADLLGAELVAGEHGLLADEHRAVVDPHRAAVAERA